MGWGQRLGFIWNPSFQNAKREEGRGAVRERERERLTTELGGTAVVRGKREGGERRGR